MTREDDVVEFHKKHGFPTSVNFQNLTKNSYDTFLASLEVTLREKSEMIQNEAIHQQEDGDPRLYRIHLILEELSELITGFRTRNEVSSFDAILDLLYVVEGAGVTFGFPTEIGWKEVHRSNMSKKTRDSDNLRLRDKGEGYTEPQLKEILDGYRRNVD